MVKKKFIWKHSVVPDNFVFQGSQEFLMLYRDSVITRLISETLDNENKNIQIGAATVFLNYAVALAQQPASSEDGQIQV